MTGERGHHPAGELVIGEVVAASTAAFTAQCIDCERTREMQLFEPPEFGTLIKIKPPSTQAAPRDFGSADPRRFDVAFDDGEEIDPFARPPAASRSPAPSSSLPAIPGTLYAAVSHASMTALDAGRRPTALGYADESELRRHQPQVFELITTEFVGALIGYTDQTGRLRRSLPPRPPRLHTRVYPCETQEIIALTDELQFLQRILKGAPSSIEASPYDLCAAIVRHAWTARGGSEVYLQQAGAQLAALLSSDYEALQLILAGIIG